ncbi:MAG TPA: hypothetical protein VNZ05_00150 [Solirubrobacteraceae bacterium]|nr:hypothetical protein [Solirubrobacteraceae bacterium]
MRVLGYSVWLAAATLLAAIAGLGLAGAIANSSYDPHTNRDPAAQITIAALALCTGLGALSFAIRGLRGRRGPNGLVAGLALTVTTALLILLLALVELLSGPL